ncbi:ArnT family glycosyltransferase [Cellulomonas sp. ICMP 17802]|uniref:ArnT family glycosyltransferase n=1 Tax=Cellulomonas sp. ICMP 17802 TaxID=3239199 RepID=UPI00351AE419
MTAPAGSRPDTSRLRALAVPSVAVAVLLVFLAVIIALVTRQGGTLVGSTTTNVRSTEVLPQLGPGDEVVQSFTAPDPRLSAVQATFGTYQGSAQCDLRVSLREKDELVAQRDWSCADLPDSSPVDVLTFEPRSDRAATYELTVERVDDDPTGGVVLWAGAPTGDDATATVNGEQTDLSAVVRPLYDPEPRWWDHLDEITHRMAAYGPSWGGAAAFATLVVSIGVLLATATFAVRRPKVFLVIVAVLALVRGLVWAAAVPAFGGMDEPSHFSNVQYLAEEHALPGQADNPGVYSPQLEVAQGGSHVSSTAPGDRPSYTGEGEDELLADAAAATPLGGGGGPAAAYPPPYYLPAAAFYEVGGHSIFQKVEAARLWTVLLGVAGAVILVLLARRLFPGRTGAQAAFAVAGVLQPMAAHQFAIVNNDAWVIVCGFAALLLGLELAGRARAAWLTLLAGVIIGFALLGKPFGIAVAAPLAVGWLLGKVRYRERSWSVLLREAGLVVLGVLATYGLWRVIAFLVDIPAQRVPDGSGARSRRAFLDAQIGPGGETAKRMWADQLWGNFGWVRIPFPEPIPTLIWYGLLALLVAVAAWVVLVVVDAFRRRSALLAPAEVASLVADEPGASEPSGEPGSGPRQDDLPLDVRILVMVSMVASIVVVLYAAAWVYYFSTGANDLLQGRYALLAVPAILALPGLLLERFSRGRISPLVVNVVLAFAMGGLLLLGLKRTLEYFYG